MKWFEQADKYIMTDMQIVKDDAYISIYIYIYIYIKDRNKKNVPILSDV